MKLLLNLVVYRVQYWGYIRRHNGKENGNYYNIIGYIAIGVDGLGFRVWGLGFRV